MKKNAKFDEGLKDPFEFLETIAVDRQFILSIPIKDGAKDRFDKVFKAKPYKYRFIDDPESFQVICTPLGAMDVLATIIQPSLKS